MAGEPYELAFVVGAHRFGDKSVAIVDATSREIRLFDSAGRHVRTVGGRGAGPGQFPTVRSSTVGPDDTILIIDNLARVSFFTPNGELRRIAQLPPRIDWLAGVFPDGKLVAQVFGRPGPTSIPSDPWTDSLTFGVYDRDGSRIGSLGPLPTLVRTRAGPAIGQLIFGPRPWIGSGELFYWARSDEYAIRGYAGDGSLRRIIRRRWTKTVPTASQVSEYKAASIERTSESLRPARRVELDNAIIAPHLPPFDTLVVDRSGRLWLRDYRLADVLSTRTRDSAAGVPRRWSIFDRDGTWLCETDMPPGLHVFDIGDDYVLGRVRDADDVAIIELHRLTLGPRGASP